MLSSRLLTGVLALLAASAVNARVCYPSSIPTLSTTVSTATETASTSESAVTTSTDTTSTDATSTEATTTSASTTDISITTTTSAESTSSATTSAATTTSSAPATGDSCSDANDCLLSTNPLCVLGLCDCDNGNCVPDLLSCAIDADCAPGQFCINALCITIE